MFTFVRYYKERRLHEKKRLIRLRYALLFSAINDPSFDNFMAIKRMENKELLTLDKS